MTLTLDISLEHLVHRRLQQMADELFHVSRPGVRFRDKTLEVSHD